MSFAACAQIVERGDPDRFLATMAAGPELRGPMFVLFAFNLEIARAPWASAEPLIAEMRLQWWRDVLETPPDGAPPAHEVAGPLVTLLRERQVDRVPLLAAVAARRLDIYADGIADSAALLDYLQDSTGGILWTLARICGEDPAREEPFRQAALAGSIANYLMALPALQARGRQMPADVDAARLAATGLAAWQAARATRFTAAKPVLRSLWRAPAILRQAQADPASVTEGRLGGSEAARRGRLLWLSLANRW